MFFRSGATRHIHRISTLPYLLVVLLLAGSAFADSQVTMKFLGHGGTSKNPVYPWYFQVDGVPTTLICDTLNNSNFRGETWQANVTNILNGPTRGLFQGKTLLEYKAAAVLFSDILFHGANPGDANWAIWALFTPSAKNSPHFNADALALYNAALALAPKLPKSFFMNYVIYTPIAGTQSCYPKCGLPQEFIGYNPVPEPGTLLLFGTGLVVLAGTIRKKLARS
jgi:PEP-CTERM motif